MNRFYTEGMGTDPLPGFPGEAAEVARFEEELGRPLRDQRYYDVFGGFRFGIIVMRAAQTMAAAGRGAARVRAGRTRRPACWPG